jgi:YidC/Oxa1 family membrane protein insertase
MTSGMLPGGPPGGDNSRNLILAVVISMIILFAYEFFVAAPQNRARLAEERAKAKIEQTQAKEAATKQAAPVIVPRETALARTPRVTFDTDAIDGSINLEGARFDDLSLRNHFDKVGSKTEVTLLKPQDVRGAFDAFFGWEDPAGTAPIGARTMWTAPDGASLGVNRPVTLTTTTPDGLEITRTIAVDEKFVFIITDVVKNAGAQERTLRPFAAVRRTGLPADFIPNQIVHQGMLGVFGPKLILNEATYQKAQRHAKDKATGKRLEDERLIAARGQGGWLGFSDHYWLAAIVPPQAGAQGPGETIDAWFDARPGASGVSAPDTDVFRAAYRGQPRAIAPGQSITYAQRFFAGPKKVSVLSDYQKTLGIPSFDKAVDWGFLWFLTRPIFWLLDYFGGWLGNFGLAILCVTVVVKLLLFPLVNRSYEAMSKLKLLQPKMKEIQERYASDPQRQQQEMIKLYQTEKVNPVAGCLPILAQIPIFYALYKTLTVTIEMRHAPFFGWIQDLSAKDPTAWVNLFGLLPFDAGIATSIPIIGSLFAIGILPILYGLTMWGVQSLSPPAPDPIQRQIFALMPILFVFLFASFAAGLVIYWTWSNILSIAQQYAIMRRNGVDTEFDKLLRKLRGQPGPA